MKKASFTLFQLQSWISSVGKSSLLILFALCMVGLQSLDAQVDHPRGATNTSKAVTHTIKPCKDANELYTDDNTNDASLYADDTKDGNGRSDTLTICPQDQWHHVTVTFTSFNIHTSDVLEVFDGNTAATGAGSAPILGTANGAGASAAFGGWVSANCDPEINPGGCLTFVFKTDGNKTKGTGWEAWVTCADRGIKVKTSVNSVKLACADATGTVTIKKPEVTSACGAIDPTMKLVVKNQAGDLCHMEMKKYSLTADVVLTGLGVGIYTAEWFLKNDTKKTSGTQVFSVSLPSLVCNDDVNIPLGSGCSIEISPDDVLENPCLPLGAHMGYEVTVRFGSGASAVVTGSGAGAGSGSASAWPIITKELLEKAGLTTCGATAEVTIKRTYTPPTAATCHNGPQSQSCTTTIHFKDETPPIPQLSVDIDTFVACDAASLEKVLKESLSALDNCELDGDPTVSVTLEEIDPCFSNNGTPDTTRAFVVVTAKDKCGNIGILKDTFIILRPTKFVMPENGVHECKDADQPFDVPGLQVGYKKNGTGEFVLTDTIKLSIDKYVCGYILHFDPVIVPATDCGRKKFINWSYINWCDAGSGLKLIGTQFIEYKDKTAPEFTEEESDQVTAAKDIHLGAFECTYDITKNTLPKATDACDDSPKVTLHKVFRIEDGENSEITDKGEWTKLDCDSFRLMYVVADQCHEQLKEDTTRQIVVIKDVTKPSAVCTDQLIVSVPSNSGARIHYSDIDGGSTDACGIHKIEVRKQEADGTWSPWGPYVDIICEDVHSDPKVELRVWDNKGNYNTCWMIVTAEDKIPPICKDLPPVKKYCDEFHNGELGADTGGDYEPLTGDLLAKYNDLFGNPATVCSDNLDCGSLTIVQSYKLTELNCGALAIERRWHAEDWYPKSSNYGYQTITVEYKPDWTLHFPADVDLTCGDNFPAAATAEYVIKNGSCDLFALEVTEKTFEVPGDICMKIERTYELINWCVYKAGESATVIAHNPLGTEIGYEGNETVGRFTYVQVLKLYVNEAPTITIADVDSCISGVDGDAAPYGVEDITPGAAPFECDEERTFSATATNCAGVALSGGAFTWKFTANGVTEEGTGSSFTRVVSPKVEYTVEFWGSDGCGNSAGATKEYEFWDCKKPTPYVLNGLAIEIMQTGTIQLWATDLDRGSYDNCTTADKLDIRIALGDPTEGPQDIDGVLALGKVVTLTCDNLGTQSISIYVIDEENNWDVVGTYVLVQSNNGACTTGGTDGMVGGKILNPSGENVELVKVSVNGGSTETMTTGASGSYQFVLTEGSDYTVTPEKNVNPLNGVSTYDLVLISKHILGITPFDTPYKYIAADVNKSGSVTAFDMVQVRQLILNITSEFPNNSSWRFVDAEHVFTTNNPAAENFSEFMNINNLDGQMLNVDFVATKIGDVNGNATSNSLLGAEVRNTNGVLNFNVKDRFVEAGQTVTVDFTSADIATAQGYQFTMNFAGLELTEVVEGVAKAANFNTSIANRGVLTTSWDGKATASDVLFSLTFKANTAGLLSELVSVNSDFTTAEAYSTAGELLDVNIDFNSSKVSAAFGLNQNTPNPFNGETVVGFNLPEAGNATLKVMDVQGKVLRTIEGDYAKGYNEVTINAKTLGATGVLYYQLESADNVASKKMIIIE